jgi:hypothetical protein
VNTFIERWPCRELATKIVGAEMVLRLNFRCVGFYIHAFRYAIESDFISLFVHEVSVLASSLQKDQKIYDPTERILNSKCVWRH